MARPRADSWQEASLPVHTVPGITHTHTHTFIHTQTYVYSTHWTHVDIHTDECVYSHYSLDIDNCVCLS